MTKLIFSVLSFVLFFNQQAPAESLVTSLSASLTSFDAGHDKLDSAYEGNIKIDFLNQVIQLDITTMDTVHCPDGAMCILGFIPRVETIELPIVEVQNDYCGIVTYIASIDGTEVDAPVETLTVSDFSNLTCRDRRILVEEDQKTMIHYKTEYLRTNTLEESRFTAEALRP